MGDPTFPLEYLETSRSTANETEKMITVSCLVDTRNLIGNQNKWKKKTKNNPQDCLRVNTGLTVKKSLGRSDGRGA